MTMTPLRTEDPLSSRRVELLDLHPPVADFRADVLTGLTSARKSLPPKYFYDAKGSALFERITRLPEYYPTRTEIRILRSRQPHLATLLASRWELIELGSGSSTKTRILLDAAREAGSYLPVDISREHLLASAEEVATAYPGVNVVAVCADYTTPLPLGRLNPGARRIVFFPGSTIGNFEPEEAETFLRNLLPLTGPDDRLVIGVDLQKDPRVLHAAYNDAAGVTARFNLNLLERINRELGANFDLRRFEHFARYDMSSGRIEMHLRSCAKQEVRVGGERIRFAAGETIHTENSYKYTREQFRQMSERAGFRVADVWTDIDRYFSVWLLEPGKTDRPVTIRAEREV